MQSQLRISDPVVLASASPRRKELISLAFENVLVRPSAFEEKVPAGISEEEVSVFLARGKAIDVASVCADLPVIGCDTVVVSEGEILNKPKNEDEAIKMLHLLSGKKHLVCTGCSIFFQGRSRDFCERTEVEFYSLSSGLIHSYVQTGEPLDKAGAYGIQGYGSLLVKRISGDYFNVVGLPISRLYREFMDFVK